MHSNWQIKLKSYLARFLIRIGRLKHAIYTQEELNDLLVQQFPMDFPVDVPKGDGHLIIHKGELSMPQLNNHIQIALFCSLTISVLKNPLYRAHLALKVKLIPGYDATNKTVFIQSSNLSELTLVEDEYSVIQDTRLLIDKFFPGQLSLLLAGTLSSTLGNALNLMTAGSSSQLLQYLQLYLAGSKQKIVDYHLPQIQALISDFASSEDAQYPLDPNDWEEKLFIDLGQSVAVEEGELRFKF